MLILKIQKGEELLELGKSEKFDKLEKYLNDFIVNPLEEILEDGE